MKRTPKRIGIFSGSFDPVHKGHIAFALQAVELGELDYVYFTPEIKPRHKPNITHIGHRLAMLKLAVRPYKQLKILELPDKHFSTQSTLPKLQQKFPDSEIFLLLGSDLFMHLDKWPKVESLLPKVGLIVGVRGGHEAAEALALAHQLPSQPKSLQVIDSIEREISSSQIRQILKSGNPTKGLVDSVYKYANKNWLYHDIKNARKITQNY